VAKRTLEDILTGEDESGLLADLKALPVAASSEAQRVFQTFEEINAFIDRNGYIPGTLRIGLKIGTSEKMLQLALNGIKGNESMVSLLAPVDRHGLLDHIVPEAPVPASLESIIDSGDALLSTSADDILTFRSTPQPKAKPERKADVARAKISKFTNLYSTRARKISRICVVKRSNSKSNRRLRLENSLS
jgi:hypothetical protein